tara:strand:- start:6221 stop:6526 length:306 start_codon:yes stop_codon:yes gene_type:complete
LGGKTDNLIDIADPFARRLVGQYLARRKEDVANLLVAVESADFDTVRITGHNLSGSGAAYGLERISSIGSDLECAADGADASRIMQLIADLDAFLRDLRLG